MGKVFIRIGPTFLNLNAIAFITTLSTGDMRITTTVRRKDGSPQTFKVGSDYVAELQRQLHPYVAVDADGGANTGD